MAILKQTWSDWLWAMEQHLDYDAIITCFNFDILQYYFDDDHWWLDL